MNLCITNPIKSEGNIHSSNGVGYGIKSKETFLGKDDFNLDLDLDIEDAEEDEEGW